MRQVLAENSKTFFALLSEANKLEVYDKRFALTASAYPYTDKDSQEQLVLDLQLPDDIADDILSNEADDIETIRDVIEGV